LCAGLSFNGNKIVTTGGGGALVTDDGDLAERIVYLSTQAKLPGTAHYEHTEVGFNYRLSNLLAAVGLGQVRRLDEIVAARRAIRQRYARSLEAIEGVSLLGESEPGASNCWLTNLIVDPERVRATPPELAQALAAVDAESRPVFKPMHRQAVFAEAPSYLSGCADAAFANGLTLPTGTELTEARQAQIIDVLVGTLTGVPV
jgi:dTDP-4-amino-4,6-dideoxygalactose transaminase